MIIQTIVITNVLTIVIIILNKHQILNPEMRMSKTLSLTKGKKWE